MSDMVNHPKHYGGADNPYEAIKVIEAWGLGFTLGNAVKYISRAGKKGDALEDLQKAKWQPAGLPWRAEVADGTGRAQDTIPDRVAERTVRGLLTPLQGAVSLVERLPRFSGGRFRKVSL